MISKVSCKGNPSIDLKETDLIQDIIFVMQGIDGHHIIYSKFEKRYVVKSTI